MILLKKRNVSQCQRFEKFPSTCFHTCFDPSTFFLFFFPPPLNAFPKRGGAQSIAPLHLSGIRLRDLNAASRTIKFMQRKNDDRINPSQTERVHHRRVDRVRGSGKKLTPPSFILSRSPCPKIRGPGSSPSSFLNKNCKNRFLKNPPSLSPFEGDEVLSSIESIFPTLLTFDGGGRVAPSLFLSK